MAPQANETPRLLKDWALCICGWEFVSTGEAGGGEDKQSCSSKGHSNMAQSSGKAPDIEMLNDRGPGGGETNACGVAVQNQFTCLSTRTCLVARCQLLSSQAVNEKQDPSDLE